MNILKNQFYQLLKENEVVFDFIQEKAVHGLWFWSLENVEKKWINPAFCEALGYEGNCVDTTILLESVYEQDKDILQEIYSYLDSDKKIIDNEKIVRFYHKDGFIKSFSFSFLEIKDTHQKPTYLIIGHKDVTPQKVNSLISRYESLLNNHSLFIIRTDMEGNYTYVNDYFCERLQLNREEIIGKSSMNAILKEDFQKCFDTVNTCLANPKESVFVQLRKPIFDKEKNQFSDEFIYTDWEYKIILDNNQASTEIQCVGIEVTERVLAEKQLEYTQSLLQTCNETAFIGNWQFDLINRKVYWDKIVKEIHEVDADFELELSNSFTFPFYAEEYQESMKKIVENTIQTGVQFDEIFQALSAKGNKKWVRAIGIPVMENNNCIKLYGTFQDISNQKKSELQLKEKIVELETTQNQLINAQKLLDATNEAAQIGTWEINLKDYSTKWNQVTKQIHEVEEDFVCDVDRAIHFYKEGYSRQIIARAFKKAIQEGVSYDEQLKVITAKGNEIWIRTIGIPTFENGKCVEMYGTFQNIDVQKTNEINLKQKLAELEVSQKQLLSTSKLLETCNASASIGTWEYDVNTREIVWDTITNNTYQLPQNIELDTLAKINFFKKGENRERAIHMIKEAREKGKSFDEELELINFRGNHKWVRIIGIPQMKDGRCVELYGTFQDITHQKQTEIQLKEKVNELETTRNKLINAQKLLDTANKAAQIGTWEFDFDSNLVTWNNVTKKIHEVEPDFVCNAQEGILFYKEGYSRDKITSIFTKALEEGTPFDEQLEIITTKGNHVWVRVIGLSTFENGKCKELYGTFQDIKPQKQAELQLKEKVEELETTQKELEYMGKLLETCNEKAIIGIWEFDLQTGVNKIDKIIRQIHEVDENYESSVKKGQDRYVGEDKEIMIKAFDAAINAGISFDKQLRMITDKGNKKWVRIIGIPTTENGKVVQLYGIIQDITIQKNAELQLKEKVTELKKAKQEIQSIQNRLTLTLEKTGIGLWEFDIVNQSMSWDEQTKRIYNIEHSNPIPMGIASSKVHPEDLESTNQRVATLINGEVDILKSIYRIIPTHDKELFLETQAILVKDEEGNPISILGVTQDITKQKEYEQIIEDQNKDLADSEQKLRRGIREMYHLQQDLANQKQQLEQIFDAVPAMIYQFKRDKEGNVSFPLVSKGAESILGTTAEQILNNSSTDIFEAIHPEDLLGFQSSVAKSADTMQKWESELRLLKNGTEVWIHASSKPTPTEDGGIVWTGIMQNIDNLKATELKIQQQNKQLQETLNELRETQSQLIHNEKMTTLGQLVASIAHEINTPLGAIHSSAGTVFKMLKSMLINLPKILNILSEKQLEIFNKLIEKSIEANDIFSSREKRAIKYQLITDLENRNINQAARIADILVDSGLHAETTLYESFLEIPQSIQIFDSIYEISSILKSNTTVRIATEKATKIIITLKNFSRQDHTGEKKVTNINESLESTLILYENKLKYGIEVIREMENLPLINVYEDEIAQVWTNLLHNSIQAIEKKGKIYISTKINEGKILVSVRDTGKGIPDEVQSKVFDAFFTTKPTGEGSGLGLNIVRKIIEKHDGKIWFETENIGENTGTTFFVELPIQ